MAESGQSRKKSKAKFDFLKHRNSKTKVQHVADNALQIIDNLEDPRTGHCDYPLREILFIAAVAYLCDAESYEDIATFGRAQIEWFRQFIPLENGIPSHDTFRRIFMLLKPQALDEMCKEMFRELYVGKRGNHLAIDGKVSRGCYHVKGKSLLNMVSAYDTETGISLTHVPSKNDEGKDVGEFNAIPKVIEQLDIKDKLVTIDAGGCYAEITDVIIDGGSYAITLKENQPTLHTIAQTVFEKHQQDDFADVMVYRETARGHGRVEERTYYAVPVPVDDGRWAKWSGLRTLVMGRFRRQEKRKEAVEFTRYYISSLSCMEVERLGQSLRGHWSIENRLHWVLDVSFGEDGNRTREGHGAENLSVLRRLALGMLKQVKGNKTMGNVKYRCAVDPEFRTTVVKKFLMR